MNEFDPDRLAASIAGQHYRRERFAPMTRTQCADIASGYAVQERLIRRWEPDFGAVASWKVGLTTARMQEMCGVDQPIAGAVFASRIHASPAQLDHTRFVRVGIEAEMGLRISATPDPARLQTSRDVMNCIDAVCAAFEIVDDRAADYARLDAVSMVADNSWNAGIILGAPVAAENCSSLLDIEGALIHNGEVIETGVSQDAGGDPLNIVRWLALALAERGRALEPGQWVMTGSIVRTQFPSCGDQYEFRLGGFPPAEVRIV